MCGVGVGVAVAGVGVGVAVAVCGVGVGVAVAGVGVGVAVAVCGVGVGVAVVGVGVGVAVVGVGVGVAVAGVGAGVAERAAEVTTFANAESCMLADNPEPSKPTVTRPTTTTRTRTEPMSAPYLRRSPGLAGPAATSAAGSGTSAHRAGAWLWMTNALDHCRPPRQAWRPARGM